MRKIIALIIFLFSVFMLHSCTRLKSKTVLTQKIQYDVSIKSPNPDYDWWVQNIERPQREKFILNLIESAYNGKIKVFDYFNKPLSTNEVKSIGVDTTYRTLTRDFPPYAEFDTIIVSRFEISDITKIRFLEEWFLDEKTFVIDKKVIGIAPLVDKFDANGNFLGLQLLFWIYPEGLASIE
ncbi:MAG: hypothetical protein GY834_07100 [Bacteroidetes bacterium]|nr:hypothetical protein [Bacteroidota bacterium]